MVKNARMWKLNSNTRYVHFGVFKKFAYLNSHFGSSFSMSLWFNLNSSPLQFVLGILCKLC